MLKSHEVPYRPWEKIAVDLFTYKDKQFLITVDYYSNFWEYDRLPDTKASTVILKMKYHLARYGCPNVVVSDNGPQFACNEFAEFAKSWQFQHRTSSPGNSKANGKVESAVKTAKALLRKADDSGTDPYIALLDRRNTPTQGMDTSPAQRLMSRRTKTLLPATRSLLQPHLPDTDEQRKQMVKRQDTQAQYYDRSAQDLPKLKDGDIIRIQPLVKGKRTWQKAQVTRKLDNRSYTVETPDGRTYRRNRYHLRKTREMPSPQPLDSSEVLTPLSPRDQTPDKEHQPSMNEAPTQTDAEPAESPAASKPLTSTGQENERERPVHETRPPAYLKDYVCT